MIALVLSALLSSGAFALNSNPIKEEKKTIILTKNAPKPIGPYSQAVEYGGMLFVSGQIGIDPESGNLSTSWRIKQNRSWKT